MLKEYKEIYLKAASALPNYKKIGQIELAENYRAGGPNKDAYLAALVLRYWNIIEKLVYKDYGLYDEKEAYDWYISSLIYAVNEEPWKDPKASIHNDPKAIEKLLNTCVKCERANWFQASNRHKRKINHDATSLDALSEDYNDAYMPKDNTLEELDDTSYQYLVHEAFNKQQYLFALVIDCIVNDVNLDKCTDTRSLVLNIRKSIRGLPENYPVIFAESYGLDKALVEKSFKYIYNMSDNKLKQSIENYVYRLRVILKRED